MENRQIKWKGLEHRCMGLFKTEYNVFHQEVAVGTYFGFQKPSSQFSYIETEIVNEAASLKDKGGGIAVCVNNRWGYPGRDHVVECAHQILSCSLWVSNYFVNWESWSVLPTGAACDLLFILILYCSNDSPFEINKIFLIHQSVIDTHLFLCRVTGICCSLSQFSLGKKAGLHLVQVTSPSQGRVKTSKLRTLTPTDNSEPLINLTFMFLNCGRKPEYPEKNLGWENMQT